MDPPHSCLSSQRRDGTCLVVLHWRVAVPTPPARPATSSSSMSQIEVKDGPPLDRVDLFVHVVVDAVELLLVVVLVVPRG